MGLAWAAVANIAGVSEIYQLRSTRRYRRACAISRCCGKDVVAILSFRQGEATAGLKDIGDVNQAS